MKLNNLFTALISAVCIGGCCCKSKVSAPDILTPVKAEITELTARKELEKYLNKCAEAVIINGDVIRNIYIGDSELAIKAGFNREKMADDSFVIKKIGNDIIINGGGTRGVLYGTFDFIERILDVRFFTPACTYVPVKKIIKADSVDKEFNFIFELRDIYIGKAYNPDGGYYAVSRGMSRGGDLSFDKKFGGSFDYGPPYSCHTFDRYLPAKEYMKKYPHFYSLRNGERYGGQHSGQLCLTILNCVIFLQNSSSTISKILMQNMLQKA